MYFFFVKFTLHLEKKSIPYSLDSGSLLDDIRDSAPTLWDDDFDVIIEDKYKLNLKKLCDELIDDEKKRKKAWKNARKKDPKNRLMCSFKTDDGGTFQLTFKPNTIKIYYFLKNIQDRTNVLDIISPSTSNWPSPKEDIMFLLVKRKFKNHYFYAFNEPNTYLTSLYGEEWPSTYRVYSHRYGKESAYFVGAGKKYYKVKKKEYQRFKLDLRLGLL